MFGMYESMPDPSEIKTDNIPLLNLRGQLRDSRELFLNEFFETGRKAQVIFKDLRNIDEVLAYPQAFGLGEDH
ncbi:MAG: hypothetical protein U5K71_15715 [Gracilimonas sp.]|nr:hypothetical protein [Gracilimonas sp.]